MRTIDQPIDSQEIEILRPGVKAAVPVDLPCADETPTLDMGIALPPKGFIRDFVDTYTNLTESPAEFYLATALTVEAGVAAPNICYSFAMPVRLNIFSLLIAPSGLARKSTALGIGQGYFSRLCSRKHNDDLPEGFRNIELMSNMFSPEALADGLEHSNPTGFVSEYRTLLGNGGQKNYQANVLPLLTDLYDCPAEYRISFKANKRAKGGCSRTISTPVISMIGATSPEYFTLSSTDVAGGFLGRHLVFYSQGSERVIPFPYKPLAGVEERLNNSLFAISNLRGEMELSQNAKHIFEENYRYEHEAYKQSKNKSNALGSFHSRKGTFWFKVAALLQVSEDRSLTVSGDNMGRAVHIVEYCGKCYQWLLSQIATDEWQATRRDILGFIRQNVGCTKSQICRSFQVKGQVRDGVLDDLVEAELVSAREEQRGSRGAPAVCYYPVSLSGHWETIQGEQ